MRGQQLKPVIITVAPTGAELTKKITPYVPLTSAEILSEAKQLAKLGASVLHVHVRDVSGRPTCNPQEVKKTVKALRASVEMIVQVSTGGSVHDTYRDRLSLAVNNAQMASVTLGSINFGQDVFLNPSPFILKLLERLKKFSVRPELEIFDVAMLEYALYLIKNKKLDAQSHFGFVLGGRGFLQATEENLDFLIGKLPRGATFSVAAMGARQMPMAELSLARGGHVRIGLEDNIYLKKGVLARGNVDLLRQLLTLLPRYKRRPASFQEAKKILKIVNVSGDKGI